MNSYKEIKRSILDLIKSIKKQDPELGEHFELMTIFDDEKETFVFLGGVPENVVFREIPDALKKPNKS